MYNKFIIIITAEKKEKYISRTIKSCLNQHLYKNLRVIVVYTKLSNEKFIKDEFIKFKNVIFLKCKIKKKFPTQDQLFKIEKATKYIEDEWVLLLDGDDLFKPNKVFSLNKLKLRKNQIYLNDHAVINKNLVNNFSDKKIYKKFILYKKLFNDWPEKINTSSIIIPAKLLKKFYKFYNPYKWKFLAIDVQLVLFYYYKNKFTFLNKVLTLKNENVNNLDKTFSNYFKKIYWSRRYEQHNMTRDISNKYNFIDRFLTIFFKNIF